MIKFQDNEWNLYYCDLVNNDVLGWLTPENVFAKLHEIMAYQEKLGYFVKLD